MMILKFFLSFFLCYLIVLFLMNCCMIIMNE